MLDVLIEVAVGGEDHYGILICFLFVAFKGAQEGIEFWVSIVSLAVNTRGIGVGLALLLDRNIRGMSVLRTMFILPMMIAPVVVTPVVTAAPAVAAVA